MRFLSKPASTVVTVIGDGEVGSVAANFVFENRGGRAEHAAVRAFSAYSVHTDGVAVELVLIESVGAADVVVTVAVVAALVSATVFAYAVLAAALDAVVNVVVTDGYFESVAVAVVPSCT